MGAGGLVSLVCAEVECGAMLSRRTLTILLAGLVKIGRWRSGYCCYRVMFSCYRRSCVGSQY